MFDPTTYKMPKLTLGQRRAQWLASHGVRELYQGFEDNRVIIFKSLPVNVGQHIVPSTFIESTSAPGENQWAFVIRVHPEWFENFREFFTDSQAKSFMERFGVDI